MSKEEGNIRSVKNRRRDMRRRKRQKLYAMFNEG